MRKLLTSLVATLLMVTSWGAEATFSFDNPKQRFVQIPFRLVNKAILIPAQINESDTLYLILDSGLGTTLLTELDSKDSLVLNQSEKIKLKGLGEGEGLEAIISRENTVRIAGLSKGAEKIHVILEDIFNLSRISGTKVNGLIGYSLFKNLIVKIDYQGKMLTVYNPQYYKPKKRKREVSYFMELINSKPFIRLKAQMPTGETTEVNLLVDTGASLALWLSTASDAAIVKPKETIPAFLGQGLSGNIYGEIGRIPSLWIGNWQLENVLTSFPEESQLEGVIINGRNGSIGGEILRRFYVTFDYLNNRIYFRKNKHFKQDFEMNLSGIELQTPLPGIPFYEIYFVNEDSPAHKAGVRKSDQLVEVNGISVLDLSFEEIVKKLEEKKKKGTQIEIVRDGKSLIFEYRVKERI